MEVWTFKSDKSGNWSLTACVSSLERVKRFTVFRCFFFFSCSETNKTKS